MALIEPVKIEDIEPFPNPHPLIGKIGGLTARWLGSAEEFPATLKQIGVCQQVRRQSGPWTYLAAVVCLEDGPEPGLERLFVERLVIQSAIEGSGLRSLWRSTYLPGRLGYQLSWRLYSHRPERYVQHSRSRLCKWCGRWDVVFAEEDEWGFCQPCILIARAPPYVACIERRDGSGPLWEEEFATLRAAILGFGKGIGGRNYELLSRNPGAQTVVRFQGQLVCTVY